MTRVSVFLVDKIVFRLNQIEESKIKIEKMESKACFLIGPNSAI